VLDQAGGRPFGICRNVRQVAKGGGGHRGSAGGRSGSTVQSQPPGRQPFSRRRHGGGKRNIRSGPVADMTGPVRRVRVRAGTSRTTPAVCPDRGRSNPGGDLVDKPLPGVRGAVCRMRTSSGDTRAVRRLRHRFLLIPEAKPACGPPDLRVIETCRRISARGGFAAAVPHPAGGTSRKLITASRMRFSPLWSPRKW